LGYTSLYMLAEDVFRIGVFGKPAFSLSLFKF
jgi:hypothetical protein